MTNDDGTENGGMSEMKGESVRLARDYGEEGHVSVNLGVVEQARLGVTGRH